ncbi:MAG: bifunctional oligoribonuclease/PAP phosphatase NrnA [Syntrophomonadaceae bacterium]|nr:bifunctional oligoribonuclease/PAP phosphatase NrnA [Syntrophomonadaceae bacterium]
MNSLLEVGEQLLMRDDYLIVGHSIPDGDCIGSILALYMGLKSKGKKVEMFLENSVPSIYFYLANVDLIQQAREGMPGVKNIIFLDCSDEQRIGEVFYRWLPAAECWFNIDHHKTNKGFGHYNYIDPRAAATAEIVYDLLNTMKVEMNAAMAAALYAGIVMDTGSFMNANTTSKTMQMSAKLIELGASVDEARTNLFESKPPEEVLLLGEALRSIKFSEDGKIAWMLLPLQVIESVNAQNYHPEGIINYTRMINGVEVGMLFRETAPNTIKIGFRSKGKIDVARIAEYYGGGGHNQAAGAVQIGGLEEISRKVVERVREVVQ